MHPQVLAMVVAEHVKDMQAEATQGRRVREARRARRGSPARRRARQLPCPPLRSGSVKSGRHPDPTPRPVLASDARTGRSPFQAGRCV
jgi:hypothetical protein